VIKSAAHSNWQAQSIQTGSAAITSHTRDLVPLVDSKVVVACDGDDGRYRDRWVSVRCNVSHRRVGQELHDHTDIILDRREHHRRLQTDTQYTHVSFTRPLLTAVNIIGDYRPTHNTHTSPSPDHCAQLSTSSETTDKHTIHMCPSPDHCSQLSTSSETTDQHTIHTSPSPDHCLHLLNTQLIIITTCCCCWHCDEPIRHSLHGKAMNWRDEEFQHAYNNNKLLLLLILCWANQAQPIWW